MRIIEYFEQTSRVQKYLREQIVQGDWRAAKFLYGERRRRCLIRN